MSKTLAHGAVVKLDREHQQAADDYLEAKHQIKRAEPIRDGCKRILIEALGDCNVGLLPDGRTVRLTRNEVPGGTYERKAYTSETLSID